MRLSITYDMHFNFTGMGHGDKYEDSSLDVFQYFNSSCYCGYSDDDQVVTSFTSLLYLFSLSQNLKWSLISLILTMYSLKLKTQQNNNHTLVCNEEMKPTYIFSVFLNYLTAVLNKQTSWLTFVIWIVFQGFYAVYKVVFELLAEEDYEFLDDKESDQEIPRFGRSDSPYETVLIVITYLFKAAKLSCHS